MRDISEMINMMVGGGLRPIQDNLEMVYMTVTVYIPSNTITTKVFFKRHSKVGKEFASKGSK